MIPGGDGAPGHPDATESEDATATLRTAHEDPAVVAAALRPDNTPEIDTRVEDDRVVTTVARDDAAGLRSTVDDYLVNLDVAERTAAIARRHESDPPDRRSSEERERTGQKPHRQTHERRDTSNDT